MKNGTADEAVVESFPASDPPASGTGRPRGRSASGDPAAVGERFRHAVPVTLADGTSFELDHGHVVIAAITSCTNTSNPSVMIGAGLVAKNAVERGLVAQPWVKTSLAPGSKVVIDYYERSGLMPYLEKLGFDLVGYGCTTCIGNCGPLLPEISEAIDQGDLAVVAVLSGNRNFEGRINADVRMNYLASPPLVVAYALAGTMDIDLRNEPLGHDRDGEPVYLARPVADGRRGQPGGVRGHRVGHVPQELRRGVQGRRQLERPATSRPATASPGTTTRPTSATRRTSRGWAPTPSAMRRHPRGPGAGQAGRQRHHRPHLARGQHPPHSPAGRWLEQHGVVPADFNSYGSRRGNHEVMIRGTFANIRLRNQLAPGTEGGVTRHLPDGEQMSIYDAAMAYRRDGRARWWCWRARSTDRVRRATGPPRAPCCSASGRCWPRASSGSTAPTWSGMGVLPLQFLRRDRGIARPDGRGELRHHRPRGPGRRRPPAGRAGGARRRPGVPGPAAHRHPEGRGVLPPRRHPPVRAAPVAEPS